MVYPQSSSPPIAERIMANISQLHTPSTTQNEASDTYGYTHGYGYGSGSGNGTESLGNYQPSRRELTVDDIADIDDPRELLEKLTGYNSHNDTFETTRTNAQFATRLQTAETTGGVNGLRSSTPWSNNGIGQSTQGSPARSSSKRPRDESEDLTEEGGEMFGFINAKSKPRKVRKLTAEEEEELAREREIWGSEPSDIEEDDEEGDVEGEGEGEGEGPRSKSSRIPDLNPRAHGVHSAAALFRKSSASKGKYTRPAMSKVFTKLELAPEDFITLQAAAKDYMLDPRHPDRSACVGTKEKRDTDMTKLKLYACVKNFLDDEPGEGWGERLFGKDSPSGTTRKFMWPQMPNRIIARITPLLRRMVTNERQRLYALNLREKKRKEEELLQIHAVSSNAYKAANSSSIDPRLNSSNRNTVNNAIAGNATASGTTTTQTINTTPVTAKQPAPLEYHINILHNGKRIRDMFTLNPTNCVGFVSFTAHVDAAIKAPYKKTFMKVLGPNGLVEVKNEATYAMALLSVRKTEWMDGDVKIIVETEKTQ